MMQIKRNVPIGPRALRNPLEHDVTYGLSLHQGVHEEALRMKKTAGNCEFNFNFREITK